MLLKFNTIILLVSPLGSIRAFMFRHIRALLYYVLAF